MRALAEEQRQKTDQLLLTSPLSVTEIVVGKFLGMVAFRYSGIDYLPVSADHESLR